MRQVKSEKTDAVRTQLMNYGRPALSAVGLIRRLIQLFGAVGLVLLSEFGREAQAAELLTAELPVAQQIAQEEQSVEQASLSGYDLLEKGWVDDAIAAFQTVLAKQPNDLQAQLGLAIAYQRAGRDEAAWNAYNAVLANHPSERAALEAVGTLGGYRPQWQGQGIDALTTLLSLDPEATPARAQRALLLGYQQGFDEAIADYEILLNQRDRLLPERQSEVLMNAAQIYTYRDRTEQALPLFEQYLSGGGELTQPARFAYATALRKQGHAATAISILQALRPQDSDQAFERLINLALAYQDRGDVEEALFVLKPALEPLPEELERRRAIANALVPIQSPPPELLPTLQSLLADPDPVTFLQFRAGQIQVETGDLEGARDSLLAYQEATPELDLGTEFLLAEIDRQSGNLDESSDRYARLLEVAEGEPQLDALRGLAAIRFEQQRLFEAEGLYRQLIALRPGDAEARRTFAELLLAKDQPKEALAQFAAAQAALADDSAIESAVASPDLRAETATQAITQRQRAVRRGFLRRRGFQPRWEVY